jgi:large subunit ribosomal protein L29
MIKASELKNLSIDALSKKLALVAQERFDLVMQLRTTGLKDNQRVKWASRNIARIKTIMHELNKQKA